MDLTKGAGRRKQSEIFFMDEEEQLMKIYKTHQMNQSTMSADQQALELLGPSQHSFVSFRLSLAKVMFHPMFDRVILYMIVCNSITLACDHPFVVTGSTFERVLSVLDTIFTVSMLYATNTYSPLPTCPCQSPSLYRQFLHWKCALR